MSLKTTETEKKSLDSKKDEAKLGKKGKQEKSKTKARDFAVIDYLHNQFKVNVGSKLLLPLSKTNYKAGDKIVFDQIIMKNEVVGNPYIEGCSVIGKCLKPEVKGKKIVVFKYKAKKNYRIKKGHRQKHMLAEIVAFNEISGDK